MIMKKGIIIIPVKNEFNSLITILKKLSDKEDVLVINDSNKKFKFKDIEILENKKNLGKGISIRKGFGHVIKKRYEYVIIMDSDGEHSPDLISSFRKKIKNKDIVFGQRMNYRSFSRKLSNKFASFWLKRTGINLLDTTCGFMAIKTRSIKKMDLKSKGFDIDIEIILESFKNDISYDVIEFNNKNFSPTGIKFKDIMIINKRFDSWILDNKSIIKKRTNKINQMSIFIFSKIGLILSDLFLKKN